MSNVSNRRGRRFEREVIDAVEAEGWCVIAEHEVIDGIEVDLTLVHPSIGQRHKLYVEAKGGTIPHCSGLARTDTCKKAVGTAWMLRNSVTIKANSYFLVGSMMPSHDSLAHRLLDEATDEGLFTGFGTINSLLAYGDALAGQLPDGGRFRAVGLSHGASQDPHRPEAVAPVEEAVRELLMENRCPVQGLVNDWVQSLP